jgi:hypothetical protein
VNSIGGLVWISGVLTKTDVTNYVVPLLRSLSNDTTDENHRLMSMQVISQKKRKNKTNQNQRQTPPSFFSFLQLQILSQILSFVDVAASSTVILPIVEKLSKDSKSIHVRKLVASNLSKFCRVFPHQTKEYVSSLPLPLHSSKEQSEV